MPSINAPTKVIPPPLPSYSAITLIVAYIFIALPPFLRIPSGCRPGNSGAVYAVALTIPFHSTGSYTERRTSCRLETSESIGPFPLPLLRRWLFSRLGDFQGRRADRSSSWMSSEKEMRSSLPRHWWDAWFLFRLRLARGVEGLVYQGQLLMAGLSMYWNWIW